MKPGLSPPPATEHLDLRLFAIWLALVLLVTGVVLGMLAGAAASLFTAVLVERRQRMET